MQNCIITAETTCDLSPDILQDRGFRTIPITIIMGLEEKKDGVAIKAEELFDYVKKTGQLPKTAAVSVEEYKEFFTGVKKDCEKIIHFSISSKASTSFNNALAAAKEIDGVYVVDTKALSTGEALLMLKASDMLQEGVAVEEVYNKIVELTSKVQTSFVVDTLDYLAKGGTNFAVLHGSDERYFLFKASPYGGEHDHYDRLALSFSAFGKPISVDLGTAAGYGAPLHYAYYKNTATHNTVVVDGENMPPCETVVDGYEVFAEDDIRLDAHTLPHEKFEGLDSFTIKQWSDEAYANTSMRRIVRFRDKYFIDIFKVSSDNNLNKDWTWHTVGETAIPEGVKPLERVNDKGPQSFFSEAVEKSGRGVEKISVTSEDYVLDVYAYAEEKQLIFAKGPDCPSTSLLSYLIERSKETSPVYVNVIEAHRHEESSIDKVDISVNGDNVEVTVYEKGGKIFTVSENLTT